MLWAFFAAINFSHAQQSAVSGTNGKLDIGNGNINGSSLNALNGNLTIPVTTQFGIQLDASLSESGNEEFRGLGSHFFWRDPERALLGLTLDHSEIEDMEYQSWGIEGEWYLGNFSLLGNGGQIKGDVFDRDSFLELEVAYYAIENLKFSIAGSQFGSVDSLAFKTEYQFGSSSWSIYAEAGSGEFDNDYALAGIRYYFGKPKSLMQRHRHDDPPNRLISRVSSWVNEVNIVRRKEWQQWYQQMGINGNPVFLMNHPLKNNCMYGMTPVSSGNSSPYNGLYCGLTSNPGGTPYAPPANIPALVPVFNNDDDFYYPPNPTGNPNGFGMISGVETINNPTTYIPNQHPNIFSPYSNTPLTP